MITSLSDRYSVEVLTAIFLAVCSFTDLLNGTRIQGKDKVMSHVFVKKSYCMNYFVILCFYVFMRLSSGDALKLMLLVMNKITTQTTCLFRQSEEVLVLYLIFLNLSFYNFEIGDYSENIQAMVLIIILIKTAFQQIRVVSGYKTDKWIQSRQKRIQTDSSYFVYLNIIGTN